MKIPSCLVRSLLFGLVPLYLVACAPRAEFHTVSQSGARRTGVYLRFSEKPQAETAQFSEEEKDGLVQELEGDAQRLHSSVHVRKETVRNAAELKKDAKREIEETLRQIRQNR